MTIAGSDPGGGAGLQADLKTFAAFRIYGFSIITAVIAQNSARVACVQPIDAAMVADQIATLRPDGGNGLIAGRSSAEAVSMCYWRW